jgi:hypothetical protein
MQAPFSILHKPVPRHTVPLAISAFRSEFFLPSKPAIIHGSVLPAGKTWFDQTESRKTFNLDYLREHASTSALQVELRNLRTRSLSRVTAPFNEAIAMLNAQKTGHPWPAGTTAYVAQSPIEDLCDKLASDLPTPQIVRETARGDEYGSSLWMGFPPTSTPLHRDPNPNFFVQMVGTKCFRMLDPATGALVYQAAMGNGTGRIRGAEMLVGEESQSMEEWLWAKRILEFPKNEDQISGQTLDCWEGCLNEGEAIFIPVGWWHSVRGIGDSSSINASVSVWRS